MWLFFPNAMLSIVAHRDKPDTLLVRARFKGDLERTFPGVPVSRTPGADYLYRAEVSRGLVAATLARHVDAMTYGNVKGAIPHGDHRRHAAMHDVWQVMFDAQHDAEPFARVDAAEARRATAPPLPRLFTGAQFQHTTAQGRPCVVTVHLVQSRTTGEPDVSLEYSETGARVTERLSKAQQRLRDAVLLP